MGFGGRDVEVITIERNKHIVVACDSCGAIGNKKADQVMVSPYLVGRLTARVVLLEILAVEAKPVAVTAASCNEPYPTTSQILAGIRDELKDLQDQEIPIAISSEKNMPTIQTGLGVTVVGLCTGETPRIATSIPGDDVYCIGIPKVGPEVTSHDDPEIVQGQNILTLLRSPEIHDIVPVGSRGIRKEADSLAKETGTIFKEDPAKEINLDKSAGPSTCVIFTCNRGSLPPDLSPVPVIKIGNLKSQKSGGI